MNIASIGEALRNGPVGYSHLVLQISGTSFTLQSGFDDRPSDQPIWFVEFTGVLEGRLSDHPLDGLQCVLGLTTGDGWWQERMTQAGLTAGAKVVGVLEYVHAASVTVSASPTMMREAHETSRLITASKVVSAYADIEVDLLQKSVGPDGGDLPWLWISWVTLTVSASVQASSAESGSAKTRAP